MLINKHRTITTIRHEHVHSVRGVTALIDSVSAILEEQDVTWDRWANAVVCCRRWEDTCRTCEALILVDVISTTFLLATGAHLRLGYHNKQLGDCYDGIDGMYWEIVGDVPASIKQYVETVHFMEVVYE